MKSIRIIKKCDIRIGGQVRSFKRDEEIQVSEEEGRDLIKLGLAVPGGIQFTKPIPISQ